MNETIIAYIYDKMAQCTDALLLHNMFCPSAHVLGQNPPASSSADAVESQKVQIHQTVHVAQESIAFASADLVKTQEIESYNILTVAEVHHQPSSLPHV
ncbi:hypothetical protein FQA39_LY11699 [Lamprigera yunnana]|nr:hypothetical protein FQA39_LY11699 [Lamprigera yunnana]